MKEKIDSLLNRLQGHIDYYVEYEKEEMDEVSWNSQQGIIISANDAKLLIEEITELRKKYEKKIKEKNKSK